LRIEESNAKIVPMQNSFLKAVILFAAGVTSLSAGVWAQTSATPPASATQETPAAKSTTGAATAKPRAAATTTRTSAPLALTTEKDKASYVIGMNIGKDLGEKLRKDSVDVNTAIVLRGMKDALAGGKMLLTDDQAKAAMDEFMADLREKQEKKMAIAGDVNKAKGDAFLATNKTKDGVITLPSGLQYKIISPGTGPKPAASDSVVCNYRGTLIDGTEFDASAKHGGPATFPVGKVIKGWTEALQLMPVGSKWQLYIPSDLAYGAQGAGGDIGPNSTLIFDIELLSIKTK
jgi:FKBP-type peptidyl-prolyl cis-trans isomerase FklB